MYNKYIRVWQIRVHKFNKSVNVAERLFYVRVCTVCVCVCCFLFTFFIQFHWLTVGIGVWICITTIFGTFSWQMYHIFTVHSTTSLHESQLHWQTEVFTYTKALKAFTSFSSQAHPHKSMEIQARVWRFWISAFSPWKRY